MCGLNAGCLHWGKILQKSVAAEIFNRKDAKFPFMASDFQKLFADELIMRVAKHLGHERIGGGDLAGVGV